MAISRQQILAAIAAETAERSGPMPAWLVTVAVGAKAEATRNAIDAELVCLRQAGLIDCRGSAAQGSGITLTDAGRAELTRQRRAKPAPEAAPAPARAAVSTPAPREPAAEPAPLPESPAGPEIVTPAASPELYVLLCDLAGLVGERLHDAFEDGDLDGMARLRGLGQRIQHHTGGPRS